MRGVAKAVSALALFGLLALFVSWLRVPQVSTAEVTRGNAAEVVYATGTVEPRVWSKVASLYRKRIIELCHCEGKSVVKGEILARLDDVEERAALAELKARRDRIHEDVTRLKGLVERNVSSRVTYDDKLTQLREYDARIAAQNDRIFDLELRAPMSGVVLRRDGEVGEIVGTANADVLFWIGQPKPLRVVAEVNEEDIARIRPGQEVLLRHDGFPADLLKASVDEITPKGDPSTKTFRVYFSLPDDTPLKIGMTVEANVVVRESKSALLVPADAIDNGGVWQVSEGEVRRVLVGVGIKSARMVEIISGLKPGDVVVSPVRPGLSDGLRVSARAGKRP